MEAIFILVFMAIIFALAGFLLYLSLSDSRRQIRDETERKRARWSFLRDNHVAEWIHFDQGYYVYHRFKMSPEDVALVEAAIPKAVAMRPKPSDIIIPNGENDSIRLSRGDGDFEKKNGSRAYEFWPIYKDGELDGFDDRKAANYY